MAEPIIVSGSAKPSNRRVMVIGAVGGVLLLLLVVFPKLSGGGGSGDDITEFPNTRTPKTTVAPPASAVNVSRVVPSWYRSSGTAARSARQSTPQLFVAADPG